MADSKLKPFMIVGALLLAAWIATVFYLSTDSGPPERAEPVVAPAPKPVPYSHSNKLPSARLREQAEQRAQSDGDDTSYGSGSDPVPIDDARGETPNSTTID